MDPRHPGGAAEVDRQSCQREHRRDNPEPQDYPRRPFGEAVSQLDLAVRGHVVVAVVEAVGGIMDQPFLLQADDAVDDPGDAPGKQQPNGQADRAGQHGQGAGDPVVERLARRQEETAGQQRVEGQEALQAAVQQGVGVLVDLERPAHRIARDLLLDHGRPRVWSLSIRGPRPGVKPAWCWRAASLRRPPYSVIPALVAGTPRAAAGVGGAKCARTSLALHVSAEPGVPATRAGMTVSYMGRACRPLRAEGSQPFISRRDDRRSGQVAQGPVCDRPRRGGPEGRP